MSVLGRLNGLHWSALAILALGAAQSAYLVSGAAGAKGAATAWSNALFWGTLVPVLWMLGTFESWGRQWTSTPAEETGRRRRMRIVDRLSAAVSWSAFAAAPLVLLGFLAAFLAPADRDWFDSPEMPWMNAAVLLGGAFGALGLFLLIPVRWVGPRTFIRVAWRSGAGLLAAFVAFGIGVGGGFPPTLDVPGTQLGRAACANEHLVVGFDDVRRLPDGSWSIALRVQNVADHEVFVDGFAVTALEGSIDWPAEPFRLRVGPAEVLDLGPAGPSSDAKGSWQMWRLWYWGQDAQGHDRPMVLACDISQDGAPGTLL